MGLYRIRPVDAADLDEIAALWHKSWHDAHGSLVPPEVLDERKPADFRERAEGLLGDTLVADTVSGNMTASIGGFVTVVGDEVDQLFVAPDQRGKGCAAHLLSSAEERLNKAGVSTAIIQCASGNTRAHSFYRKHGYLDQGIEHQPLWRYPGKPTLTIPTHMFAKRLG